MRFTLILVGISIGIVEPLNAADFDAPPVNYTTANTSNVITALQEQLNTKKAVIKRDDEFGYLKSLLSNLNIPTSSQVLVFSKTSLQRSRIGPKTPRALYYNDDVSVGFCRNGEVLEIAASDPNLGTVFYTLEQHSSKPPKFTRQTESCLICHGSSRNQGYPGHLVRSVSADNRGELVLSRGSKSVDHTTPLEDRWGGWYVTGTSGKQTHMGNQIVGGWSWAEEGKQPTSENIVDLKPYFTIANYPTTHSDIISLMVLEHQTELQNRLTRANFQTRQAQHEQAELNKAFNEPAGTRSEGITKRIQWACEPVVKYLFFCEETKLTEPVVGTSDFAKEFAARGPFDSHHRTLREFDLKTRMFRYPFSYLIYSQQFDGLPSEAKDRIYRRVWEVLTGLDNTKDFEHISKADRAAILEILRETKAGLPSYWKK